MDGDSASLDTSITYRNAHYDMKAQFITGTSLDWGLASGFISWKIIPNVSVSNFFPPSIDSLDPNGGEVLGPEPFIISWTATDPNTAAGDSPSQGEVLSFSVEVTNDAGFSWRTITYGTTQNYIVYDPHSLGYGLDGSDMWLVRLNCTDGMWTVSRTSAATFTVLELDGISRPPYELYVIIGGLAIIMCLVLVLTGILVWRRRLGRALKPAK
jgi:hypothetical protein